MPTLYKSYIVWLLYYTMMLIDAITSIFIHFTIFSKKINSFQSMNRWLRFFNGIFSAHIYDYFCLMWKWENKQHWNFLQIYIANVMGMCCSSSFDLYLRVNFYRFYSYIFTYIFYYLCGACPRIVCKKTYKQNETNNLTRHIHFTSGKECTTPK